MAIGFQVNNLELFLSKNQKGDKGSILPVTGDGAKCRIPGVGEYQRFFDGINKLHVEISCPGSGKKSDIGTTSKKGVRENNAAGTNNLSDLAHDDVYEMIKDPPRNAIDKKR